MTTQLPFNLAGISDRQAPDDPALRRADWRFLLPRPSSGHFEHMVVLGGPPALARRLAKLGLARQVSSALPAGGPVDALVILCDANVDVYQSARRLTPGGVLYVEVDRRSPPTFAATPGRVRRALRGIGLSPVGTYWVTPDFSCSQRYLPLDAHGALAWYITSHYAATSPARRLAEGGLRALLLVDRRVFAPLIGCYAVIAIAGDVAHAPAAILSDPALPGELRQPDVWPLLITGGSDDIHRMILLPFATHARQPLAVLKMARLPEFNRDTLSEQALLARMRSTLAPAMAHSIPRPAGLFRYGEALVGIESCRPGRSLSTLVGRWGMPLSSKIEQLERVTSWLIRFHNQAQVGRQPWGAAEIERWVTQPLAAYTRLMGTTPAETRLFDRLRTQADLLIGASLPIVWQHHNFGEWNILYTDRTINVIDWEHARAGVPLYDLLHFVLQWSYSVCRRASEIEQLDGFRELFCDQTIADPVVQAARRAIDRYMDLLDIDKRFLALLLIFAWIEKAIAYAEAQREYEPATLDSRDGNRSVAYIGILAEHIDQLFTEPTIHALGLT
jgi:aminoglycoside phosphotransferase (APT) family kinase protein